MLKKSDRILCGIEDAIIAFGVFSASVVLFANVVLRFFFNSGWSWAEEYARYAIIWVTFAGSGVAVRKGVHMRILALHEIMSERVKLIVELIINLVSLAFALFLVAVGGRWTYQTFLTGQCSAALLWPKWVIYISVPLGGLLSTIRLFQLMAVQVRQLRGKKGV